jgi:hypothetical protein
MNKEHIRGGWDILICPCEKVRLFLPKTHSLLDGNSQLLLQCVKSLVWRQVKPVEAVKDVC